MAIKGVNLNEKEEFILPEDPGHPDHAEYQLAVKNGNTPEKPTTYYIGNLTSNDRVELGDMTATPTMRDGGITMTMRNTQRSYEVVRRGLKGWENQQDYNGQPVKFETETAKTLSGDFLEVASNKVLAHLSNAMIVQIATRILEKNGMQEDLAKKSEGASPLSEDLLSGIGDVPNVPTINDEKEDAKPLQSSDPA